jgi:hypothetical protein
MIMLMLPSGVGFAVNVMGGDGNEGGEGGGSGDDFVPASDTATATSNPVGDAGAKALDPDAPYSVGQVVEGVFDFAGEGDDDLPFTTGTRLVITESMGDSWYNASPEDDRSKVGSIPGNYVKPV